MKIHAVYPTPFWRAAGLSGRVTTDTSPVVQVTADNSPASGTPGVFVALIKEDAARRLERLPAAERRATVLADLANYFGDQAANPTAYVEKSWGADKFSRGVYGGFLAPGVWTAYGGALREQIGPLHWAGTETATTWNGKMEGALLSGERAAAEVLAALDRSG